MKLVIKNGRVVDPKNGVDAVTDVFIDAGKIIAVGPSLPASMPIVKLNASGLVVSRAWWICRLDCASPALNTRPRWNLKWQRGWPAVSPVWYVCPILIRVLDEPGLVEMLKHRAQKP